MVLQTEGEIVAVMRWQALVKVGGRGWAAVQGAGKEGVLSVLEHHLVVPARGN
jgi:hypothetical protein